MLHHNREQLHQLVQLSCQLFESLGLTVNQTKSLLTPMQSLVFLGLNINSGDASSSRETEKNPTRCQTTVVSVNPVNSAGSTVCGESHSYNEGSTLQSNTEVNEFCGSIPRELANTGEIRCCSAAGPNQQSIPELLNKITISALLNVPMPSQLIDSDASMKGWGTILNN